MTMTRLDPFAGVDRLFDLMYGRSAAQRRSMPIDIYRNGDRYTVEIDLPGADPSSIDLQADGKMLTIRAEARSMHENADEQVLCERMHAQFFRQVYLGDNLDMEHVDARYDNGVLRIEIPVREPSGARKIEVTKSGEHNQEIGGGDGHESASPRATPGA